MSYQKYSKLIVAVVGFVAMLVASGTINGAALNVANAVIAIAAALGVYTVPNKE